MASSTKEGSSAKFSVKVDASFGPIFDEWTSIFVSGGHVSLGHWNPSNAIRLQKSEENNQTFTTWSSTITFSDELEVDEVSFRYFIGRRVVSSSCPTILRVLKWETSLKPRKFKFGESKCEVDEFGRVDGNTSIGDSWLSDAHLSEVRFFLFDRSCIEFHKPNTDFTSSSFKITLKALEKKGENEEVINKETARSYSKVQDIEVPCENYVIGQDLLCFRAQTSGPVDKLSFRFHLCDAKSSSAMAIADVKLLNRDATQGTISGDLIDPCKKTTIGKLTAKYLVIHASTPAVMQFCTLEKSYMNYWKRRPPLDVGHRGMGRSYTREAKERENTLKSLVVACEKGADFVELDVQLTKDQIPVLYHDFQVCLEENGHLKEVAFKDLTMEELKRLNIRHTHDLKKPETRSFMSVVDRKQEKEDPSCSAFPYLEDVLKSTPPFLGFNIEIKYPMFLEDGHFECDDFFEMNFFLDRILEVVFKNAKYRRIIFSSFCPEVCMMLNLKQNRYPILFLTQGVTHRYPPYANPLTRSSEMAIAFVLSEGLLGVCFHSEELLQTPDLIKKARNHGLVSFVWGDDLDETKHIEFMKRHGLDGVIYDRLDEHTPEKRNIFAK